jgi:hypothetical protein
MTEIEYGYHVWRILCLSAVIGVGTYATCKAMLMMIGDI